MALISSVYKWKLNKSQTKKLGKRVWEKKLFLTKAEKKALKAKRREAHNKARDSRLSQIKPVGLQPTGETPPQRRWTYIYALVDPRTGRYGYIGKSNFPKLRFAQHMNGDENTNPSKTAWLKEIRALKLTPHLIIIEKVRYSEWVERERHWIKHCRVNHPLTNMTDGGEQSSPDSIRP